MLVSTLNHQYLRIPWFRLIWFNLCLTVKLSKVDLRFKFKTLFKIRLLGAMEIINGIFIRISHVWWMTRVTRDPRQQIGWIYIYSCIFIWILFIPINLGAVYIHTNKRLKWVCMGWRRRLYRKGGHVRGGSIYPVIYISFPFNWNIQEIFWTTHLN